MMNMNTTTLIHIDINFFYILVFHHTIYSTNSLCNPNGLSTVSLVSRANRPISQSLPRLSCTNDHCLVIIYSWCRQSFSHAFIIEKSLTWINDIYVLNQQCLWLSLTKLVIHLICYLRLIINEGDVSERVAAHLSCFTASFAMSLCLAASCRTWHVLSLFCE